MTKKMEKNKLCWNTEREAAFETLKQALASGPIVKAPDLKKCSYCAATPLTPASVQSSYKSTREFYTPFHMPAVNYCLENKTTRQQSENAQHQFGLQISSIYFYTEHTLLFKLITNHCNTCHEQSTLIAGYCDGVQLYKNIPFMQNISRDPKMLRRIT